MDRCKHVGRLRLAPDHSILNPQKWHCVDCNTSESIWACLGCAHVACGRYIKEHALRHFEQQRHPLAMEINELYVFCYLCDDYVLNDNATGDLKLLRSTLGAIQSQRYEVITRSGRTLRSTAEAPAPCRASELQLRDEDRMFTALWHRRRALMGRVFRFWLGLTDCGRARQEEERRREREEEQKRDARERRRALKRQMREQLENAPQRKSLRLRGRTPRALEAAAAATRAAKKTQRAAPRSQTPASRRRKGKTPSKPKRRWRRPSPGGPRKPRATPPGRPEPAVGEGGSPCKRRPTVTPGVTGLRNLGNTCYMNSILQVLSHLHVFRECFLRLDLTQALELLVSAVHGRLATEPSPRSAHGKGAPAGVGLSGGASPRGRSMELIQPKEPSSRHISLCHELHTLFQVMWSGKWALVSPFAMLHSVWQLIPAFRGYAQQDAQEFLCELLDKVQRELESVPGADVPDARRRLIQRVLGVVNTIFHGQLLSQVTCLACQHRSDTVEPFWDLSLEFPERYHSNGGRESPAQASCHLTEMLAKFTETEALEGNIYACQRCNSSRRRSLSKAVLLTKAQKQLMVHKLPQVLRLHLKRFRWSGRNHREKIGVHVSFDQLLNMAPYCHGESSGGPCSPPRAKSLLYELSAVVMHHGKGFGSGHYTAYCYNSPGGFWVHCNDSKMSVCSVDEVCRAQAYILFYTRRLTGDQERPL
ncbi:ubiquitin carboxyl-terminal hydrolase 44 [Syngnathus scovelli]|uniref:ubiquitin carboxyl-terminal hydrolase 44 n=1 Tax=Syngnathus scovelli TaxID=161590 RepID=UPI00210F5264|nr:ubiquitin carboxyl-terminal hydrolase 44 [Syngnathus scovelli]